MRNKCFFAQLAQKGRSFSRSPFLPIILLLLLSIITLNSPGSRVIASDKRNISNLKVPTPNITLSKELERQRWEWIEIPSPVEDSISGCDFLSVDDGWVISVDGFLFHWDGKNWLSCGIGIFQTKRHWREEVELETIRRSTVMLAEYATTCLDVHIRMPFPALGTSRWDKRKISKAEDIRQVLSSLPNNEL